MEMSKEAHSDPVVSSRAMDKGKAILDSEGNRSQTNGARTYIYEEDMARCAERGIKPKAQLEEFRTQKNKLKITCSRQKQAIQNLCFWLSHRGYSLCPLSSLVVARE